MNNTTHTSSQNQLVSLKTLEREMVIAGIVWIIVGALCVVAANAWAMGA